MKKFFFTLSLNLKCFSCFLVIIITKLIIITITLVTRILGKFMWKNGNKMGNSYYFTEKNKKMKNKVMALFGNPKMYIDDDLCPIYMANLKMPIVWWLLLWWIKSCYHSNKTLKLCWNTHTYVHKSFFLNRSKDKWKKKKI